MQVVSTDFVNAATGPIIQPKPGLLVSWLRNYDAAAKFFQLDHSYLDGPDPLKGNGDFITFFDKFDYMDETANLKSYRIIKKVSARPWGLIMATAEIELDNTSKRYLPGFDPVIGDYIKRDRPVKLSIGFGDEYISLFTGFSERPESSYVNRTTKLKCFDALAYLSTKKSDLDVFVDTTVKDIIEDLLIEQGFSSTQFNIEESTQLPIGYLPVKDRIVTDIFQEICEAEGALMFVDERGVIQFWNRLHFAKNQTSVWDFTYSNLEDIGWDSTNVVNDVLVTSKPLKPAAFNKIYELSEANDDTLIPAGGSKDIFVEFKDDLGTFPAISVDTPVYIDDNTGSSVYATNYNKEGDGDTGADDITLTSVHNFGNTYRMTFSNAAGLPIYITQIQLFGQPAKVTQLATSPQINQTSIDEYGLNPDDSGKEIEIKNDLVQDVSSANSLGYMLIQHFSDPMARMELPNFPVPHLQIGDATTVHILDTEEEKHCFVMGLEIFFGVNANLYQKTYVEERPLTSYFQLDISYLDGPDKLAL